MKMAQELGGARLRNVVAVKTARMSLKLEDHQVSAADLPTALTACRTRLGPRSGRPGSPTS